MTERLTIKLNEALQSIKDQNKMEVAPHEWATAGQHD